MVGNLGFYIILYYFYYYKISLFVFTFAIRPCLHNLCAIFDVTHIYTRNIISVICLYLKINSAFLVYRIFPFLLFTFFIYKQKKGEIDNASKTIRNRA